MTKHFGGAMPNAAAGLILRHDHGSKYMAEDFQAEIRCFGITSSPAFVRQPEGNGVAERAIRTLKEQLLRVRHFATIEELRQALAAFAARYNASWLRERHGYKTPDQIRAHRKPLAPDAATGFKMAASSAKRAVSLPCPGTAPAHQHLVASGRGPLREQRVVSNAGKVIAVGVGMSATYVAFFTVAWFLAICLFGDPLLSAWTSASSVETPSVRLRLAALGASLSVVIGALGASFEPYGYFRHVAQIDDEI